MSVETSNSPFHRELNAVMCLSFTLYKRALLKSSYILEKYRYTWLNQSVQILLTLNKCHHWIWNLFWKEDPQSFESVWIRSWSISLYSKILYWVLLLIFKQMSLRKFVMLPWKDWNYVHFKTLFCHKCYKSNYLELLNLLQRTTSQFCAFFV